MKGQACEDSVLWETTSRAVGRGFVLATPVLLEPQYLTEAAKGEFILAHRFGRSHDEAGPGGQSMWQEYSHQSRAASWGVELRNRTMSSESCLL